jgi:hypothetical protein
MLRADSIVATESSKNENSTCDVRYNSPEFKVTAAETALSATGSTSFWALGKKTWSKRKPCGEESKWE